jgi:hypothetical protein
MMTMAWNQPGGQQPVTPLDPPAGGKHLIDQLLRVGADQRPPTYIRLGNFSPYG